MECEQPLCAALLGKIQEQVERTAHLIALLPADRLDWAPAIPGAWTVSQLLGHLLDCLAGLCAALAAHPDCTAHLAPLRELPVNHRCLPAEAIQRIELYRTHIVEVFAILADEDLARRIPTLFVPAGESLLTLLLGNLEHLINHKHELFIALKQIGVEVNSRDLYQFRGPE